MASYSSLVTASNKKFKSDVKAAKTRGEVTAAFRAHKAEHQQLLKEHLAEELEAANKAKEKIG